MITTATRNLSLSWSIILAFARFFDRVVSAFAPPIQSGEPAARADSSRDCVLVLDASGSMLDDDWFPTRLAAAKEAAIAFCERLKEELPDAYIAIVAYGDSSKTICPLTKASRLEKLADAIDKISCLGMTNMPAGIESARRILSRRMTATRQVVLLTDGHNTEKNPKHVAARLRQFAIVECIGIGGSPRDVDESLMKELASAYPDGTKRYRWIGDKEQLVQHFHDLAGGISRQ